MNPNVTLHQPRTPVSPLDSAHAPYFVQHVNVGEELIGRSRLDVFAQICTGKRVLHVGCVDWPITDVRNSLHVQLDGHCRLDGMDIHTDAFAALQPHLHGRLFPTLAEAREPYDIVLVPEVLEHVPDVKGFLEQLNALDAKAFAITVPDAFSCFGNHFDHVRGAQTFVEVVHPDHNCWYSPYTLTNVIRKYTSWSIQGVWFFNRMSLLLIASRATARDTPAN